MLAAHTLKDEGIKQGSLVCGAGQDVMPSELSAIGFQHIAKVTNLNLVDIVERVRSGECQRVFRSDDVPSSLMSLDRGSPFSSRQEALNLKARLKQA